MTTWIVTRTALRGALPILAVYWAIMVLVVAVILIAIVAAGGRPDVSVWSTSGASAPKYFLFAIGAMQVAQLPVYIGHGVTRREFARGALLYLGVVAVFYGTLMALGYLVERPIYVAKGLIYGLEIPYPVSSVADGLTVLAEESLVGLAYLLVGWLIGTLFYLRGAWIGLLLIPVAALPLVAVEMVLDSLWMGFGLNKGFDIEPPPLGVGLLVALAAVAVTWTVNYVLVRDVPVKKVSG